MSPPPQAVRPRPTTAARATSRVRADPRPMMLFPFCGSATVAEKLDSFVAGCRRMDLMLASPPRPGGGVPRDPVEHHAERRDRAAGRQSLAEELLLAEARDHDVAQ